MNGLGGIAVLIAGLACVTGAAAQSAAPQAALAVIDAEPREGGMELIGRVVAMTDVAITGELRIERRGGGGTVSTQQSRALTLSAGQKGDVARVSISYQPGDRLDVTLRVMRDGTVVSLARLATVQE